MGTGVIVAERGFMVTNFHVVEGVSEAQVLLADGRNFRGTVAGADPATDLAVLRLEGHDLPHVVLGDSDLVRVGQFAIAVGNSLGLPGGPTVSLGVVSALGRPLPGSDFVLDGLLQTDAAINPGNSGGPLANLRGEVIGINTAMVPYAQGVGFAIPSNTVRTVVDQVLLQGRVVRPWLGISGVSVGQAPDTAAELSVGTGVLVMEVAEGGPAARAGVWAGDVIQRVANHPVSTLHDLLKALATVPVGGHVDLTVVRGRRSRAVVVQLGEAPPLQA
jgi:serine protease Do